MLRNIGSAYYLDGDLNNAEKYFDEFLTIYEKMCSKEQLVERLNEIMNIFLKEGDFRFKKYLDKIQAIK